jgi:hypothetical protein
MCNVMPATAHVEGHNAGPWCYGRVVLVGVGWQAGQPMQVFVATSGTSTL